MGAEEGGGYEPFKRGTLLIASGPARDPNRKHLFVIVTDRAEDGTHLLVPISSWTGDHCDATRRIMAHEHSWLRHDSYALYARARIMPAAGLSAGVEEGSLIPRDDASGAFVLRVWNGVCESPLTPRKIKAYAGCHD